MEAITINTEDRSRVFTDSKEPPVFHKGVLRFHWHADSIYLINEGGIRVFSVLTDVIDR